MAPATRIGFPAVGKCAVLLIGLAWHCFVAAEPAPQARNLRDSPVGIRSAAAAAPREAGSARVTGSWVNSTNGPAFSHRGVIYQAAQIAPIGRLVKPASRVRKVNWRYSFLTPVPHGLQAYLCNYARCVALSGAIGTTAAFEDDSAYSHFSFAFVIDGNGGLSPALQGQSNYVAVSYE